jgi:hypothetical protein
MCVCFDVLEYLVDENKVTAVRVFSTDEASHTFVQLTVRIIARKRKHQVPEIIPCERGQDLTGA